MHNDVAHRLTFFTITCVVSAREMTSAARKELIYFKHSEKPSQRK